MLNLLSVPSMSSMPFLYSDALTCFVCFPSDHQVQYSSWKTNHVPAVSGRIAPETHRQHLGLVWRCLDSLDNVLHVLHCSCYAWSQAFQLSCSTAAHSCNHDLVFFSEDTKRQIDLVDVWWQICMFYHSHVNKDIFFDPRFRPDWILQPLFFCLCIMSHLRQMLRCGAGVAWIGKDFPVELQKN